MLCLKAQDKKLFKTVQKTHLVEFCLSIICLQATISKQPKKLLFNKIQKINFLSRKFVLQQQNNNKHKKRKSCLNVKTFADRWNIFVISQVYCHYGKINIFQIKICSYCTLCFFTFALRLFVFIKLSMSSRVHWWVRWR